MTDKAKTRREGRLRRHRRVRKKVRGTESRPRLSVYRSNKHISAQIIDDYAGVTIASANTLADVKETSTSSAAAAAEVGTLLAERAKTAGIDKVVFDRGGYRYHGRVAALADAAREGGLEF